MLDQQQRQSVIWQPSAKLGVVGAGVMGRGIVQIAAQAGIEVILFDANQAAMDQAIGSLREIFERLVSKGKLTPAESKATLARITCSTSLEAFSCCAAVVEAIIERLDAKQELLKSLEAVVSERCILATNTSSLSVTSIAATCTRPERVAGFHCFNPVPLMKLIEVIAGVQTELWVTQTLTSLAEQMGHTPVLAKDTPGFVVNHAGRGMISESLRIESEGIADFQTIDAILRDGVGFRLGPFELMDLTGLDVSLPVMETIYQQFYHEPRYRPTPMVRQRLEAGLLGRKVGKGFYRYDGNNQLTAPLQEAPKAAAPAIWVNPEEPNAHKMLSDLVTALGGELDPGRSPAPDSLCLLSPLGADATSAALALGVNPRQVIAIDILYDLNRLRTLMPTPITSTSIRQAAHQLFTRDGVPALLIRESAGFIAQRVLANIVNVGCELAQQRIATPVDIDNAVRLGLGYPKGPLAWGDSLGTGRILTILENLYDAYKDPRYRASAWLSRRSKLNISLLYEE